MAKTSAERQQSYRKNRPLAGENGERRLNTWVSSGASLALHRLSERYCVTNRAMLEHLILEADQAIVATLDPDTPEWHVYFGETLRSNVTE